jgi:hypothetical protein
MKTAGGLGVDQTPAAYTAFVSASFVRSIGWMPMRAEEIEDLMHSMNQHKITHNIPENSANGDEYLPKLPEKEPE